MDKSDSLDDESDDDGSDCGSSGTCAFPFPFDDSVGRVSGVGSGVFVPIVVEYKYDVVKFVVFIPTIVKSKSGQLIKMFWCSNFLFPLQISKSVL